MKEDDLTRYERIHAYLDGEMDAESRKAFEATMTSDPELADAVRLEEEVRMLVRYQRRLELKNMLRNISTSEIADQMPDTDSPTIDPESPDPTREAKTKPPGGIRPPFWRYTMRVAGVAAALIAAVLIFWPKEQGFTTLKEMQVIADANTPHSFKMASRGGDDRSGHPLSKTDSLSVRVDSLLEAKAYDAALALLPDSLDNDTIHFQRGLALLGLGKQDSTQYIKARLEFDALSQKGSSRMNGHAKWCLVMTDLYQGDLTQADKHLQALIDAGSPSYGTVAAELREKLRLRP